MTPTGGSVGPTASPDVAIIGAGAVGSRVADQVAANGERRVRIYDRDPAVAHRAVASAGGPAFAVGSVARAVAGAGIVVIATCRTGHLDAARRAVAAGATVISTSDVIEDVRGLLALDTEARRRECGVLVGAGFAPGFTCLLAEHLAGHLDHVDEIHVAKQGTGGPLCARTHHRALSSPALDWRDGAWRERPGGSGRELVWFPEPVNGADCYRGALPDALVLQPAFPGVQRITARLAATRRDRFTSWLPMLLPPHTDGGLGAVRVEVRGRVGDARQVKVAGAAAPPSFGAAAVVVAAITLLDRAELAPSGAHGLAGLGRSSLFLAELRSLGVLPREYVGFTA